MRKTLSNYYLLVSFIFIFVVAIFVTAISHSTQFLYINSSIEDIQKGILQTHKDELKNRIEIIEQLIYQKAQSVYDEVEKDVKNRVYEAHTIATKLYETNYKTKSENEIKELIKSALRDIRFNDGRGYFFIDDKEGNCILYPIRSHIEGKNIINYQDINQKYVIKNLINIAMLDKEGYTRYHTYKYKYEKDAKRYEKIAFVKLFEPYNWIIGTGEYVDDAEQDIKVDIAKVVNTFRVENKTSYVNIFEVHNFKGGDEFATMIVNPNRKDIYGKKISSNVTDIDGRKYRQEALEKINKSGDGYITYKYQKLDSKEISEKLTYVKKLKLWDWVLSTGVYLDHMEAQVQENLEKLEKIQQQNHQKMWIFFSLLFLALLLATLMISRKISFESGRIINFFKRAVFRKEQIQTDDFAIEEFKSLAVYANEMVKAINKEHDKLEELNSSLEVNIQDKTKELEELNIYLQEKNKELEKNYYTDFLTGLYNRNKFHDDLLVFDDITVVVFDIDSFKNINDFYGMKTGDNLLKTISITLYNLAKEEGAYAYRLSSDEFLLCFDKTLDNEIIKSANHIAQKIAQESYYDQEHKLKLGISLTFAIADGKNNVLEKADLALNYAKANKLSHAIFNENNPHMNTHKHKVYWREKIQWAIDNRLVEPYFQPIIDTENKESKKYESLMRIVDGDEVILPSMFLEVSKETKQYPYLTRMMIEKCFETFKDKDVEFSLNISVEDIKNDETKEFLLSKIKEYSIGEKLILEVLESEDIMTESLFFSFVEEVRAFGVRFAIDDFGSGYSNFAILLKLSPKFLKIDGSLIKEIHTSEKSFHIVKSIVSFSEQIGATPIAEFVESEEIVKVLHSLHVKLMQGYHFAAPSKTLF